ncbi:MAG: hypothetical protein AAGB05_15155 [Pseudomonadota bacterium]
MPLPKPVNREMLLEVVKGCEHLAGQRRRHNRSEHEVEEHFAVDLSKRSLGDALIEDLTDRLALRPDILGVKGARDRREGA